MIYDIRSCLTTEMMSFVAENKETTYLFDDRMVSFCPHTTLWAVHDVSLQQVWDVETTRDFDTGATDGHDALGHRHTPGFAKDTWSDSMKHNYHNRSPSRSFNLILTVSSLRIRNFEEMWKKQQHPPVEISVCKQRTDLASERWAKRKPPDQHPS